MHWLAAPNLVTFSRVLLVFPLIYSLSHGEPAISIALFVAIVLSDVFDGILARNLPAPNPYGTLIDHGADAFVVVCLCTIFSITGLCSALLPVAIAIAFAQYALDTRKTNSRIPRASLLGKFNGINYYLFCACCLIFELLKNSLTGTQLNAALLFLHGYSWALVLSSIVSVAQRLNANQTVDD